jgi:hypothetical protein
MARPKMGTTAIKDTPRRLCLHLALLRKPGRDAGLLGSPHCCGKPAPFRVVLRVMSISFFLFSSAVRFLSVDMALRPLPAYPSQSFANHPQPSQPHLKLRFGAIRGLRPSSPPPRPDRRPAWVETLRCNVRAGHSPLPPLPRRPPLTWRPSGGGSGTQRRAHAQSLNARTRPRRPHALENVCRAALRGGSSLALLSCHSWHYRREATSTLASPASEPGNPSRLRPPCPAVLSRRSWPAKPEAGKRRRKAPPALVSRNKALREQIVPRSCEVLFIVWFALHGWHCSAALTLEPDPTGQWFPSSSAGQAARRRILGACCPNSARGRLARHLAAKYAG